MKSSRPTDGQFPETRWTRVMALRMGADSSPDSDEALAELCQAYWLPIYAFARRIGDTPHEAEDAAQEFFGMVLTRKLFQRAEPDRGKFRSYLLGAFNLFRAERKRTARRIKRGGREKFVSFSEETGEQILAEMPVGDVPPELEYDRIWARTLVRRTLRRLEDEYADRRLRVLYHELAHYLLVQPPDDFYPDVARRHRMTAGAVRVAVYRLRQRFKHLLEEEVAHTILAPGSVEEEIRYLARILPPGDLQWP